MHAARYDAIDPLCEYLIIVLRVDCISSNTLTLSVASLAVAVKDDVSGPMSRTCV